jgi:diguanylate cyclase (GGDEF)-like protein
VDHSVTESPPALAASRRWYQRPEFLFYFTGTGENLAAQVCEDLRRAVEDADWSAVSPGLAVTVSMGLTGRAPGSSVESLVAAAGDRLYRAKQMGRNRVVAETTVTYPSH